MVQGIESGFALQNQCIISVLSLQLHLFCILNMGIFMFFPKQTLILHHSYSFPLERFQVCGERVFHKEFCSDFHEDELSI